MRRFAILLFSTTILLGLSTAAFADELLKFTNVSGTNAGGVYTGIYYGTLNGGSQQNFMCDDYSDHINFGESWAVTPTTINNLSGVTFHSNFYGGLSQLQAYAEALHIAQGLLNDPTVGDPQASIDSFAIWSLLNNNVQTSGAVPASTGSDPNFASDVTSELASAGSWYATQCLGSSSCLNSLSDVVIYVPDTHFPGTWTDGRPQEFLSLGSTPTPEPVSMILMGTFLSLAGGMLGRKKRAK